MNVLRFFIGLAILITTSQVSAKGPNPFDKAIEITAGSNIAWQFGEQTATKSVQAKDGTWYHLYYDGLRLRLRLTGSTADTEHGAKQFDDFAINDVKVDGKRLKIFQWCLNNQDKHSRFLQQGLSVKKEVCQNQGERGTFTMRLTKDTIASLNSGNAIEYDLKPFRTTVRVKFNISDFDQVSTEFKRQQDAKIAASKPKPAAPVAPVVVAKPKSKSKSKPRAKCKVGPPEGFSEVSTISYNCDDVAARDSAKATVDARVNELRRQREQAAAEAERKRKAAEAARLAQEEALKKEQEALAASAAVQAELSSDIAKKMIAVCEKNWAQGEHRCYCEKYIEFAPASIKANSTCN